MIEIAPRTTAPYRAEVVNAVSGDGEHSAEDIELLLEWYSLNEAPVIRGDGVNTVDSEDLIPVLKSMNSGFANKVNFEVPLQTASEDLIDVVNEHNISLTLFLDDVGEYFYIKDDNSAQFTDKLDRFLSDVDDVNVILVPTKSATEEVEFVDILDIFDGYDVTGTLYPVPTDPIQKEEALSPSGLSDVYTSTWEWMWKESGANWQPFRDYQDTLIGSKLGGRTNRGYIHYSALSRRVEHPGDSLSGAPTQSEIEDLYTREATLRPKSPNGGSDPTDMEDCTQCKFWSVCLGGSPHHSRDGDLMSKSKFCQVYYDTYDKVQFDMKQMTPSIRLVTEGHNAQDTETLAYHRVLDILPMGKLRHDTLVPRDKSKGNSGRRLTVAHNSPHEIPPVRVLISDAWDDFEFDRRDMMSYAEMVSEYGLSSGSGSLSLKEAFNKTGIEGVKEILNDVVGVANFVIDVDNDEIRFKEGASPSGLDIEGFESRLRESKRVFPETVINPDWAEGKVYLEGAVGIEDLEEEVEETSGNGTKERNPTNSLADIASIFESSTNKQIVEMVDENKLLISPDE